MSIKKEPGAVGTEAEVEVKVERTEEEQQEEEKEGPKEDQEQEEKRDWKFEQNDGSDISEDAGTRNLPGPSTENKDEATCSKCDESHSIGQRCQFRLQYSQSTYVAPEMRGGAVPSRPGAPATSPRRSKAGKRGRGGRTGGVDRGGRARDAGRAGGAGRGGRAVEAGYGSGRVLTKAGRQLQDARLGREQPRMERVAPPRTGRVAPPDPRTTRSPPPKKVRTLPPELYHNPDALRPSRFSCFLIYYEYSLNNIHSFYSI